MSFMEWDDDFLIGISEIDEQHKNLIDLVNSLHAAMLAQKGNDILGEVISQLVVYTGVHFSTEEELFTRSSYPDSSAHAAEHQHFIEKVETFYKDFQNRRIDVSVSILNFLTEWLRNHILINDKKYGPFIIGKLRG